MSRRRRSASYAGEVKIDVYVPDGGNLPGSGSGVEYSIASNQRITMGTEDFNYVSRDKNGSSPRRRRTRYRGW